MSSEKNNPPILFAPHPGAQWDFLSNEADELLFASCVGAGKSLCLLVDACKYVEKYPTFNALLLRRTFPELEKSLIKISKTLYTGRLMGHYHETKHLWTFPNGARIQFGSFDNDNRITDYRGVDWTYIGFDELTTFKWEHYQMISLWLRSTKGVPLRVRATSNAGGLSHDDVYKHWENWLNPEHRSHLKSNQIARIGNKTRSCVLAYPKDNPSMPMEYYEKQFQGKPKYIIRQLLENDWRAKPSNADYFKGELIKILPTAPAGGKKVRAWDFAATEGKGDYSVGLLLNRQNDGTYVIEDMVRKRVNTANLEKLVLQTAALDGKGVKIVLPHDPGSAGVAQKMHYAKLLNGYTFEFDRATKSKFERALPVSSQALVGNLCMVAGRWNKELIDELEAFDEDPKKYDHDDAVDALSTAYNSLLNPGVRFNTSIDLKFPRTF